MLLTSSVFKEGDAIPARYTCDGENVSPPLIWSDVPEGTRSLALIAHDPDAPGGTWVHWVVWDIDPAEREIPEGVVAPGAVEGMTDFGELGYGGPCPPDASHRYFFTLYALDIELTLSDTATANDLRTAMKNHIIADACLMGTYITIKLKMD